MKLFEVYLPELHTAASASSSAAEPEIAVDTVAAAVAEPETAADTVDVVVVVVVVVAAGQAADTQWVPLD